MTRRRPPVRRRPRRRSRRQRQAEAQLVGVLIPAAVVVAVVVTVVNWLATHWWALVVALVLGVPTGAGWVYQRRQQARWEAVRAQGLRYALPQLDALHHTGFEHAVRELMARDGCRDALRVGGAGTWARM